MPEVSAFCKGNYMLQLLNHKKSKFVQIYCLEKKKWSGCHGHYSVTDATLVLFSIFQKKYISQNYFICDTEFEPQDLLIGNISVFYHIL